jgi:uncharacterized protein (TIGR00251 family)
MEHPAVRLLDDGVALDVWIVPGASRSEISGTHGDRLKVRVVSPPEGGRANREVESVLSEALGMGVELTRGMRSRAKTFKVAGLGPETVIRKLGLT